MRLKAIDNLKRGAIMTAKPEIWECVCATLVSVLLAGAYGAMCGVMTAEPAPRTELDASCAEEHGVIALGPEQDPNGDVCGFDPECASGYVCVNGRCLFKLASPEKCDNADNNCLAADDESLNVVFVMDTSPSMESHLGYLKEAMDQYIRESSADLYFQLVTTSEIGNGNMIASNNRVEFASAVSQVQVNPKVSEENISLLLEEAAHATRFAHALIFAFTDEEPRWPPLRRDYYNVVYEGISFCSLPRIGITIAVITTPEHVSAWRELGSCVRVYGDL